MSTRQGVPLIHIREDHPLQSVKTGTHAKSRYMRPWLTSWPTRVKPMTISYLAAFPHDKNNGRSSWLTSSFGRVPSGDMWDQRNLRKTLYSFRHRFIDATRNAGMTEELSKALTGHSTGDVHGKYGRGAGLKTLAEALEKVDPLADD